MCQLDVLFHSEGNLFFYCWKTFDDKSDWKVLYLRHRMLTWKIRIAQGNLFTFDYNLGQKQLTCSQGILDKHVGWPNHKLVLDKIYSDLKDTKLRGKELKFAQPMFKWLVKSNKQYLRELGYNLNHINKKGRSYLHHAATFRDSSYIKCLLPKFDTVNIPDSDNVTPLHEACRFGNFDVAKMLLEAEADANARIISSGLTSLMIVAQRPEQDIKFVKLLLKHNASVDMEDVNAMRAVDFARQVNMKSPIVPLIHPILSQI